MLYLDPSEREGAWAFTGCGKSLDLKGTGFSPYVEFNK